MVHFGFLVEKTVDTQGRKEGHQLAGISKTLGETGQEAWNGVWWSGKKWGIMGIF